MGAVQTSEASQTVSEATDAINSAMSTIINSSTMTCNGSSTVTISAGSGGAPCYFNANGLVINASNNVTVSCTLNSSNLTSLNESFKTTIDNTIDNFLDQSQSAKNGWLAVAFNVQTSVSNTKEYIRNTIKNAFTEDVSDICNEDISAMAKGTINLCGTWNNSTINFNQDASITSIANCVSRTIIDLFASNGVLNDIYNKTEQIVASANNGIDTFFIYIVVAIVIISVIGTIAYYLFGGKRQQQGRGTGEYRLPPRAPQMT